MILFKLLNKLNNNNQMLYLYNQMSLPAPLSDEIELFYVKKSEKGDLEARNFLIEHNMRLVVFIAKRFESPKVLLEDLISIGSMGLLKAVNTFRSDKNIKLATYASRCIENEILMYLRKASKMVLEVSLDEPLNIDSDGNELLLSDVIPNNDIHPLDSSLKDELELLLYQSVEKLIERERKIITLRFGLYNSTSYTQKEVANLLGISQSYISRLEKRIMRKLKYDIEKKIELNKKNV